MAAASIGPPLAPCGLERLDGIPGLTWHTAYRHAQVRVDPLGVRSHMDVFDAGVFAYRFEAEVPGTMRTVLWGPLHARELGLPGWEVQDGGETGFVYHKRARAGRAGSMNACLVVANRARRAVLTITLAGFPTTVAEGERNLEVLSIVTEAEVFCTRLAGDSIRFQRTLGITLLDQNHPQEELLDRRDLAPPTLGERHQEERRSGRRLGPGAVAGGPGRVGLTDDRLGGDHGAGERSGPGRSARRRPEHALWDV